jgi:glycosyltransferase involved in cell wall biosynthesis
LLKGLAELDQKNEYYLYLVQDCWLNRLGERDNFNMRFADQLGRFRDPLLKSKRVWIPSMYRFGLYEQLILPTQLRRDRIDLFHSTQNTLPWVKVCKSIVTAHYVTPILHPEYAESLSARSMNLLHRVFTPFTIANADRIIAVGESVKREVTNVYGYDEKNIRVIQPCVDESFKVMKERDDIEKVTTKYGITDDYILCMDSASFHDEFISLLKAFSALKKQTPLPHKFVIAGSLSAVRSRHLDAIINILNLNRNDVVRTGYVSDYDLVRLYNGAALFVYPVTHEGFGIIPLEAMACGTPVIAITSTATMIHEMMGGAGITIDPQNLDALFQTMYNILTDPVLRSKMTQRGLERAAQSSWRTIAEKTLEVYNEFS